MKYLFILFVFISSATKAQDILKFDKLFIESEDKWVAFKKNNDNKYSYGFIYIDAQAGLTFNSEGSFKISDEGKFVPEKLDSVLFKLRLQPNNVKVAFIPENKFDELKISPIPQWLKYYKTDTNSVSRLYRWGFIYNAWEMCAKALTYLERAEKIDPEYKGLAVELAFSYNCLSQFDKAILILQSALKTAPTDAYTNKELVYAYVQSEQLDKAAESCKKAIAVCTDKQYNSEMCYNLLHHFYFKKDKKNFDLWTAETRKWATGNQALLDSIKIMEDELGK